MDRVVIFQEGHYSHGFLFLKRLVWPKDCIVNKKQIKEIVIRYIDMGAIIWLYRCFCSSNDGMKQRVAIARALSINPRILLMDEPFAALDIQTRGLLCKQLLQVHQETKKTILL